MRYVMCAFMLDVGYDYVSCVNLTEILGRLWLLHFKLIQTEWPIYALVIGSYKGLLPVHCQAIVQTNAGFIVCWGPFY